MARPASHYVCQQCGASHRKWTGRCDDCGVWNSVTEEAISEAAPKGVSGAGGRAVDFVPLVGTEDQRPRIISGIGEFDRVCGGGLVDGSALLVGGDPGIGKSTLLLQAAAGLASAGTPVAYISGEEAVDQIRQRAARLGLAAAPVDLAAATSVRDILATLDTPDTPKIAIIDSIQTMYVDTLDSAPGSVAQVRSAAQELVRLAKRRQLILVLVGHVTKEGAIAGPRVVEHMVDTVLYFESKRGHQCRILRAVKNRYGPTDEIGVFEMTGTGLAEVTNPSELFLAGHSDNVNGTVVLASIEGTRPVLVEIQALVSPTALGTARRAVVGWDSARLAMVLAVLQTRCGINLSAADVYLNVAGGLRISEPAADLAVAAALISAHLGQLLPTRTVVFGEIGLGGEVRAVGQSEARLREAEKLGFTTAIVPQAAPRQRGERVSDTVISSHNIANLQDLFSVFDEALTSGKTAAQ
jgi:DNA repair protein RadA/Sms